MAWWLKKLKVSRPHHSGPFQYVSASCFWMREHVLWAAPHSFALLLTQVFFLFFLSTLLATQAKLNWQQKWWVLMKPLYNISPMFCVYHLFCAHGVVGHLDRGNMYVSQWEWSILTRCFGDTWQPSGSLNFMYKHMANSGNCVLWNSDQVGDTEGGKEREVKEEVVCVIPLTAAYLSIHGCSVPVDSCPRMPCPVYFFTKFARSVTQPCFFFIIIL